MKNQNYLKKYIITFTITLFLFTGITKADLPFDPNDFSFLVYVPQGTEDSIVQAMTNILGAAFNPYADVRTSNEGEHVTAEDLITHDILIVGWNYEGDTGGLDDEILEAGITGRVILTGHDLDYHTVNGPTDEIEESAETMLVQAIDWILKGGGTGLLTLGCTAEFPYLPEAWDVTTDIDTGEVVSEFTTYGLYSGVYDGLEPNDMSNWSDAYHNIFTIEAGSSFVPFELGGSLEYAQNRGREFVEKSVSTLSGLGESDAKNALIETAGFIGWR